MHTTEVEVNEIQAAYAEGLKDGRKLELERVLVAIKNQTCFDYLSGGNCDHAACWSLSHLKDSLRSFG
jgi:hypothetical protein